VRIEKRINEIVNRLNKTKEERFPDLRAEREERDRKEREDQRQVQNEQRRREKEEMERKEKDKELRLHLLLVCDYSYNLSVLHSNIIPTGKQTAIHSNEM